MSQQSGMQARSGYSVAIKREDGSEFLCCSEMGLLPPVWTLQQRRYAVQHKRDLVSHGFKARVVRVEFADVRPVVKVKV